MKRFDLLPFELQAMEATNKIIALFYLLDLIVINDQIIFDQEHESAWKDTNAAKSLKDILRPVRLSTKAKVQLSESSGLEFQNYLDDYTHITEGALYYLSLGRFLGVYYWPSPERARYLASNMFHSENIPFIVVLNQHVNDAIRDIAKMALKPLELTKVVEDFPGFGSIILADCKNRENILSTALQVRESKVCTAFRAWLRKVDSALQLGDIKTIAQAISDVRDVSSYMRSELRMSETPIESTAKLQIGISPSLSIETSSIHELIGKFKPKPYHMVFLRHHFERALSNVNMWAHVNRLFPETKRAKWIDSKQLEWSRALGRFDTYTFK